MDVTKKFEPVDVSSISKVAKDDLGLLPQPKAPKYRIALVQIYVRCQPFGGCDKSSNGHRFDSIPFANGMINAGMSCQLVHYVHQEHDAFFEVMKNFDAIIVRCNPGQINADGGSQDKFDAAMRGLQKLGIQVWPLPDVMELMGAKDALTKIADLRIGLPDTLSYYDEESFKAGFKKTMAFQPRVIKQNRGSSGEGIWITKLKSGNYCANYGDRSCTDDEVLELMEANDNHAETHTVGEFIEFCTQYLSGGMLVDQRFCPRVVEGELRLNLVGRKLVGIIHTKPKAGHLGRGRTDSIYTYYGPEEPLFKKLTYGFLEQDMDKVMPALGLGDHPMPLWWTSDFINASPVGTKREDEKWIVGEFNCSCVGISKCLPAYCSADTPDANWNSIPPEDQKAAMEYGNLMGQVALEILNSVKECQSAWAPDGKHAIMSALR